MSSAFRDVAISEKIFLTFQLEVTNKGGHSSIPQPDNAITRLAAGLVRVGQLKFPVRITATTRAWFARMAEFEAGETREDMLALAKTPPDPAAVARYGATTLGNPALRTTCVVTQVSAGHDHTCALQPDSTAVCWGNNHNGELGATSCGACRGQPNR